MIARGDIRWFRFARPDKRRPVVVLGRPEVMATLSQIVVVPCTTTMRRGLPWEVVLDDRDGMAVRCTLRVEWIRAVARLELGARIATFPEAHWPEVRQAVVAGLGLCGRRRVIGWDKWQSSRQSHPGTGSSRSLPERDVPVRDATVGTSASPRTPRR